MALADIVNISISLSSVNITQAGFGIPLILGTPSWVTDRIRFYSGIGAVAVDFAVTRPEYLAAAAIFAQNPRPPRIAIGRLALKPTQKRTITLTVFDNTAYALTVGGQAVSVNSGSSSTATSITTLLKTAINALSGITLTATGTTAPVLTENAAGGWTDVVIGDPNLMSLMQDHVDPGVATDLAAIKLVDNTWYGIINPWNSQLMALAISAWAESNVKLFIAATQDTQTANVAFSSATDVMKVANTSAYFRSTYLYHPSAAAFADAAWAGNVLPLDPGSETWKFKTLAGVPAVTLTDTQRINILNKKGNLYETIAGRNITEDGTVSSGEFIDVVRFRDWLEARMGERVFGSLVANKKIPYTDPGVTIIRADVQATLKDGVRVGGLDNFDVFQDKVKNAIPADKAARHMKLVTFAAELAGAIHLVDVTGSVST